MNSADFPRVALPEALDRLAAMPAFLGDAIARASDAQLAARAAGEEFSLGEHACHLRDVEREGYTVRVERMLTENVPDLAGFDGATVARERDYASQDGRAAAADFAVARRALVARLGALPVDAFSREALFQGRRIMLCDLLGMMVAHDGGHREEIEAIVGRLGAWR